MPSIAPLALALIAVATVALAGCSYSGEVSSPSQEAASLMAAYEKDSMASADALPLMSTINGEVPPEKPTLVADSTEILNVMRDGQQIRIYRDIRDAGTRAPIHVHPFGGWTCVVTGTAVLYKEGAEPITAKAGDCFDMPPLTPMSNVNPGPGPSVLLDSCATPPDSPIWRIIEEGQTDLGNEFTKASATPSP